VSRLSLRLRLMLIGTGGLLIGFGLGSVLLLAILATTLRHSADDQARTTASQIASLVEAGSLSQPVPVTGPSLVQVVDRDQRWHSEHGCDRRVDRDHEAACRVLVGRQDEV